MAGFGDPMAMTAAEKLGFLVTQVTSLTDLGTKLSAQFETLNRRIDSQDTRLACMETTTGML
jgi:hypothetical protein